MQKVDVETCIHLRNKQQNPGVVVSQNFGDSTTDAAALAKLQELYPGRVARISPAWQYLAVLSSLYLLAPAEVVESCVAAFGALWVMKPQVAHRGLVHNIEASSCVLLLRARALRGPILSRCGS